MITFYEELYSMLKRGDSFVLTSIVRRRGSAPRNTGAKMAVKQDGSIIGTIGGGSLEGQVQGLAPTLWDTSFPMLKHFDLTSPNAKERRMICGGSVDVLLQFINAKNPAHLTVFEKIVTSLKGKKTVSLYHLLPITGTEISQDSLVLQVGNPAEMPVLKADAYWVDSIVPNPTVYIFGAGHVSQKLAPVLKTIGFDVVVVDDRPEYANSTLFPTSQTIVVPSLEDFSREITICDGCYVIIVTRGHLYDMAVLQQVIASDACYIGMIGSHRKKQVIYQALIEDGIAQEELEKVTCPVGLSIGAETPEEIAISIAAELIAKKSEMQKVSIQ
ncbi:hypothetical protein BHU72_10845 [Desulfuribacillus stibiiarsenatis]|uniref:Xanthine dehydrogenase n=1 Tax=Desulfuribacillus stibiiarsenatis TaxID=1390249 RepID=A0A1E5L2N8_9FIRM|nr:XdhC/CoxI family protein [Desulfuribacillus stibiiarsenatis]OEH84303.1 hypothetical protein BHU72_10845 [Desulfuribacillus stibiiarsenatis]